MAALTWADVVNVAPELSTVSSTRQTLFITLAEERVSNEFFRGVDAKTYLLARAYLAAHFATMPGTGSIGPVGATTSMSEGGVSESFSQVTPRTMSLLSTTSYGRMFLLLVGWSPAVAGFVT